MQTLAFGFSCQDEDIVSVGRKTHTKTPVLWRQRVNIQALLQMGKWQILTQPFSSEIWLSELWAGVWAGALRTGSSSGRAAASSCGRALVLSLAWFQPQGCKWTCLGRGEGDASSQLFAAESMWAAVSLLFPKTDINTMQPTHRIMQKSTSQVGLFSC